MESTTTREWVSTGTGNFAASISIYDSSSEMGTGWILIDDVYLAYQSSGPGFGNTYCQERDDLIVSTLSMPNLITNPAFVNSISTGDGWFFGGSNQNNSAIGGILEIWSFSSPFFGGQIFQNTGRAFPVNTVLALNFNAANQSNERKRISVILNDPAWSGTHGVRFCNFWLEPNSPMRTYRMWTHTDANWASTQISIYESSGSGRLRLDNFHLRVTDLPSRGTQCNLSPSISRPNYTIQIADPTNPAWKPGEHDAIYRGVEQAASALFNISTSPHSTEAVFNRVIPPTSGAGSVLFVRGNTTTSTIGSAGIPDVPTTYFNGSGQPISVVYPDINNGGCFAFDGGGSLPRAVVCNGGSLIISEYTVVHELGHLFDYRISSNLTTAMYNGQITIGSCPNGQRYVIMGYFNGGFTRGSRGWGSGSYLSNFQQSGENTPIEAAADMFLNWVYRSNSLNSSTSITYVPNFYNIFDPTNIPIGCQTTPFPEPWSGFLNRNWAVSATTFDLGMPGEVRYAYMNQIMNNFFLSSGW
jgi:hypothetical protein